MAARLIYLCLCLLGPVLATTKKCNNEGVQWAGYNNTSGPNNDPTYSTFQTTSYAGKKPLYHAVTSYVGGNYLANVTSPGHMSIYGSKYEFSVVDFVLNHQGYVHAPADGTYTFAANTVDDILLMWFGTNAHSGWTRSNADCDAALNVGSGSFPSCSHTVTLKKGQYLPFRMLYGQYNGGAAAFIKFTDPSGQVLLDSTSHKSKSIVQHGCGKSAKQAPKFPAW